MNKDLLRLYAVTDRHWLHGGTLADAVESVLRGGATLLQLREKQLSDDDFLQEARCIQAVCDRYHVPLIINDNVNVARKCGPGVGIHVGQGDAALEDVRAIMGPDAIIGVSCQTVAQAIEAEKGGADYLGVGAVFSTSTKADADYVDARELAAICAAVKIPVVAIGGISKNNLPQLAGSGIAGIAVISALFGEANPEEATRFMLAQMNALLNVPVTLPSGAIIDLDGTILDSMPYWNRLGEDYLLSKGKNPRGIIHNILNSMEVDEAANFLKKEYGLNESAETIKEEILNAIRRVYVEKAPLLPYAKTLLESLHRAGTRLALFTAAEKTSARAALERNGVADLFDCIISTMDISLTKAAPEAYYYVLGRLGTPLGRTTIYEDADYAIEGARKTSMTVITPEEL